MPGSEGGTKSAENPTENQRGLYDVPGPDSSQYSRNVGMRKPARLSKVPPNGCAPWVLLGIALGVIVAVGWWWLRK